MSDLSRRPATLAEVSRRALAGQQDFDPALREFLHEFYSHRNRRQAAMQQQPDLIDDLKDAYLAAVAEHLASIYRLDLPEWVDRHGRPVKRAFVADGLESLKAILTVSIMYHHAGRWRAATRGAFESAQAQWAQARLDAADLSALRRGTTYLAEATYPENRIVVRYGHAALVLVGAFDGDGVEPHYDAIQETAAKLRWPAAPRHAFGSVSGLLRHARELPGTR